MSIYVTGDKHRWFSDVKRFCEKNKTTKDDILILLGDSGINYEGWAWDHMIKENLDSLPITFLIIHGNHEIRPQNIPDYVLKDWNEGKVWTEYEYPSLLFAKDGEIFEINNKKFFVCGGAYSVDKKERYLQWIFGERLRWEWWPDEEPSLEIKQYSEEQLKKVGWKTDYVLTHTCPKKYVPEEAFITVEKLEDGYDKTEVWLDKLEDKLEYTKWYCGHFHINKKIKKIEFLFDNIIKVI